MATIWITYAWADNSDKDVDFVAQELEAAGITVKLDRWNISAGKRLWEQLDNFIGNPAECDAWLIYATGNSLGSEPCKEEFAYALDRALSSRGQAFPVIALFPASVDQSLIPTGIRTRLYVSLRDVDWKERIVAATEGRQHLSTRTAVEPYHAHVHQLAHGGFAIEVRPRAGSWAPAILAVLQAEIEHVRPSIMHGPAGRPPNGGALYGTGTNQQAEWHVMYASNEATPTMSYFLLCKAMPTQLAFGMDGDPKRQYKLFFNSSV